MLLDVHSGRLHDVRQTVSIVTVTAKAAQWRIDQRSSKVRKGYVCGREMMGFEVMKRLKEREGSKRVVRGRRELHEV